MNLKDILGSDVFTQESDPGPAQDLGKGSAALGWEGRAGRGPRHSCLRLCYFIYLRSVLFNFQNVFLLNICAFLFLLLLLWPFLPTLLPFNKYSFAACCVPNRL